MDPKKNSITLRFGKGKKRKAQQLKLARQIRQKRKVDEQAPKLPERTRTATEVKFKAMEKFALQKSSIRLSLEGGKPDISAIKKENNKFAIVDLSQLTQLVCGLKCNVCDRVGGLEVIQNNPGLGLVMQLKVMCNFQDCKSEVSKCLTSKHCKGPQKRNAYELNSTIALDMVNSGGGYHGLEKLCCHAGMSNMHQKTFVSLTKDISKASFKTCHDSLEAAGKIVRETYAAEIINYKEEDIINIAVSFDGSWMKRGHVSNFGIGVVIDLMTGLVLDFEVMSKYCHGCGIAKKKFKEGSVQYKDWQEQHVCDRTYTGTSGGMEAAAAVLMWERSILKHGFRYAVLLSDGDAKTFSTLSNLNVYGASYPLSKEECINHVGKRLGSALRKLVDDCRAKGTTLGGRGVGRLTKEVITRLTTYYERAIRNNSHSVEDMRQAVFASFLHAISTDDDPHHARCPADKNSWCFYNRAIANGKIPGSHSQEVHTPISKEIAEHVLPIYNRLGDIELLQRCLRGKTQNANESFHAIVWNKCPKTSFLHKRRVILGVELSILEFNCGRRSIVAVLQQLGVEPQPITGMMAAFKDWERLEKSVARASDKMKKAREVRKRAILQSEQLMERDEGGPSYVPGGF